MLNDLDNLPMVRIYAAGMASLLLSGIGSAGIQAGSDSFWPFFLNTLGAFVFFGCFAAMLVKMFRAAK